MNLPELLSYCSALEKNNNRTWFHENHDWYERAWKSFYELLEELRFVIAGEAPSLAEEILRLPVKGWTYRTARDMRFYRDRPPYEPSFRAYISSDKKSWLPIGYFLRLAPGRSCFGFGLWCEDTAGTNRVRDCIAERYAELWELLSQSGFEPGGAVLKRAPRGYDEKHPAIDLIKHKYWEILLPISDSEAENEELLLDTVQQAVSRMEPLRLFFLDAANGERTQKQLFEDFYTGF